jgi:hypothetical protein
MRVNRKIEVTLDRTSVKVGELLDILAEADRGDVVDITHHLGDRPGDFGYISLTVRRPWV